MCMGPDIAAATAAAASAMGGASAAAAMGAGGVGATLGSTGAGLLGEAGIGGAFPGLLAETSAASLSPELAMAANPMLATPADAFGAIPESLPNVIGSSLPGGAGGSMDMFGTADPSYANLGAHTAPMSFLSNYIGQSPVGAALDRTSTALNGAGKAQAIANLFQPQRPQMQQMQRPQQQQPAQSIPDILAKRYGLNPYLRGLY